MVKRMDWDRARQLERTRQFDRQAPLPLRTSSGKHATQSRNTNDRPCVVCRRQREAVTITDGWSSEVRGALRVMTFCSVACAAKRYPWVEPRKTA